ELYFPRGGCTYSTAIWPNRTGFSRGDSILRLYSWGRRSGFAIPFTALVPEFSTFFFGNLFSIPPVRLRETGEKLGLSRLSHPCYIPFRCTGAAAWRASTCSPKVPRQGSYYTGDIHDTPRQLLRHKAGNGRQLSGWA